MVIAAVDRVQPIQAILREEASAGEARRSPSDQVVAAMDQIDGWRLLLPERWGGKGLSVSDFAQVQIELAKADPAIAWLSHIVNGTSWAATLAPDQVQHALFADGPARVVGAYNPPGQARHVPGGYRISGSFPYASGCRQADWFLCSARIEDPAAKPLIVYAAMADARIEDSWFVTGLQGTGSDTCVFEDAFVADAQVIPANTPLGTVIAGRTHDGAASDRWPLITTVRTLCAALVIGAAEEMLSLVREGAHRHAIPTTSYARQAESPVFQHHLGEASAKIGTGRLVIEDACRKIDCHATVGGTYAPADAAANKARIALAIELALVAVERLMTITGSHAYASANPMQRYWRDIHMAASHVTLLPHVGYEIHGRELLGIMPNITPTGGY